MVERDGEDEAKKGLYFAFAEYQQNGNGLYPPMLQKQKLIGL